MISAVSLVLASVLAKSAKSLSIRASTTLYDLIRGRNLVVYPADELRLAVSQTVAVETPRGFRLAKEKAASRIDVIVALAMAAQAVTGEPTHTRPAVGRISPTGAVSRPDGRRAVVAL